MTDEQLIARLRGGCVLLLDSNAAWRKNLLPLADQVNIWNDKLEQPDETLKIRLIVSSFVHGEHLAQERRRFGSGFDLARTTAILQSKNVEVVSYSPGDAEKTAEWLASLASTDEDWRHLKWKKAADDLQLGPTATPKKVSATIDWFIAGHAVSKGALLVTTDGGIEFREVPQVTRDRLMRALTELASGPTR